MVKSKKFDTDKTLLIPGRPSNAITPKVLKVVRDMVKWVAKEMKKAQH